MQYLVVKYLEKHLPVSYHNLHDPLPNGLVVGLTITQTMSGL